MNAPSAAPLPPPSREAELARAETELASAEARLAEQLSRAAAEAESLTRRLGELRQEVSRAPAENPGDEHMRHASARLESASVYTGSLEDARERALTARHEALEARRQASEEVQAALKALHQLNTRARQELAEAEVALKRSAEAAAAKAQQERMAAARAQQERTVVARVQPEREVSRARPVAPQVAPAPPRPLVSEPSSLTPRSSRVRMRASIDMRSDSNFFTGFSTNISEGGLFVATVQTLPRGTTVDLDFTLPGGRPMKVTGVVRWTREVNDKTPELMPGVGVQFVDLPPEVASAISNFVATREPLFFPD